MRGKPLAIPWNTLSGNRSQASCSAVEVSTWLGAWIDETGD